MCVLLATHYNRESLKPENLWGRIGGAFATASAKVQDGDVALFVNLCLEYVKADPVFVAADEIAAGLVCRWDAEPVVWRQGWMRWIANRSQIVVTFGRQAWEQVKVDRAERRAAWRAARDADEKAGA